MKATAVVLTLASLVAACGGSPTRPSSSSTSSTVQASAPQPTPPSSDPTKPPDPIPPQPSPGPQPEPAPTPTPGPQADLRLAATTDGGVWSDPSQALPSAFNIEVWPDRVQVGEWTLPRDSSTPEQFGILASDARGTFTLQRGQLAGQWIWRFGGAAGHASGVAQER